MYNESATITDSTHLTTSTPIPASINVGTLSFNCGTWFHITCYNDISFDVLGILKFVIKLLVFVAVITSEKYARITRHCM